MKKSILLVISLILLLSMSLTACNLGSVSDSSYEESIAQTMVAMSFTQTALAEPEVEPAVAEETEAPPVVEETTEVETETPAPTVEVTHNITPNEPGWINKWFYDTDASKTASGGYVNGGDDFVANLFERPFTETDMVYRPDVDINKSEMSEDSTFYYVTLYLNGLHPEGGLQAIYGIEIDTNKDGRGDLLVIADRPTSSEWDIAGVSAHKDPNHDVGGTSIMRPDASYGGDGYEQVVFSMDMLDDPDIAWARVSTGTPPTVTLAFKKSLISGASTFVWGVWAADSLLDPALIDLHDNFTQAEAGSPYQSHSTYPLAALNLVDNTCRETYGFEADVPIPGLCYIPEEEPPAPTPTPTPTATPTPTRTPTEQIQTGTITGVAFDDTGVAGVSGSANNGVRESGEPYTVYTVTMSVHPNSCSNPFITSATAKGFTAPSLAAGTYCVKISPSGSMTTPSSYTFYLAAGATQYVEFGYYVVQ